MNVIRNAFPKKTWIYASSGQSWMTPTTLRFQCQLNDQVHPPWVDGNTIHEELPGVRIPRPEAVVIAVYSQGFFACGKPLKINMESEKDHLQREKHLYTNQQFLVSMLIFRGVPSKTSFLWQFGSTPNLQWFQDIVPRCFCMLNKKMSSQVHHPSAHTWICVGVPVYSFYNYL